MCGWSYLVNQERRFRVSVRIGVRVRMTGSVKDWVRGNTVLNGREIVGPH